MIVLILLVLSLPVGLALVAFRVYEINRERERDYFRAEHGFHKKWKVERQLILPEWYGEVPRIDPPRARETTAQVRLVPHPTDYRKFVREVNGLPEDPFEPYAPMRGTHGTGPR